MTDFIVKKRRDFIFAVEDAPDKTFTLPSMYSLDFDDAALLAQAGSETDIVKRGKIIQKFMDKHVPELKDLDLGGMEYFEIFNAYSLAMGQAQLGESKASQDS